MQGKQRFIWTALFLVLAAGYSAAAQQNTKALPAPQLTVISPKPGQTFDDTPIFVQVQVKNFKLVPPLPYFGKPGPQNIGHLHYILDDYPLTATADTQLMIGKMLGDDYLPQGKHTLWVELSVDNHDSLTPPVRKKIVFYTMHPRRRQSGPSG